MKLKNILLKDRVLPFFLVILGVVYLSLWRATYFDFWRDDWGQIWAAVYKPELLLKEWAAIRLHPGSAIEQFLLSKIFGLNPYPWQIFGLGLKALNSVLVGLMSFGLTKSKKTAWLSGLLYASWPVGLESYVWISANTSALVIAFLCPGVYFWTTRGSSIRRLLLGLVFLNLAISVSPARGFFILFLMPLYELIGVLKREHKKDLFSVNIVPILVLLLSLLVTVKLLNTSGIFSVGNSLVTIISALSDRSAINNLLVSLGSLMIGWLVPIEESGSLLVQNYSPVSSFLVSLLSLSGLVFLVLLFFFVVSNFRKRNGENTPILFLLVWAIGFFIPNFVFDPHLTGAPSHRYLTISSIGIVCSLAYLLSSLKNLSFILAGVILVVGIVNSNRILFDQGQYRSTRIVENIWDEINNNVPSGANNLIFIFQGKDDTRRYILDWAGSVPFGIKRGIKQEDAFPIVTSDGSLISKLLCQANVYRPSLGKWTTQEKMVPLSHLYDWSLENNNVVNLSDQTRKYYADTIKCN